MSRRKVRHTFQNLGTCPSTILFKVVFLVVSIIWTGATNLLCPDLFPKTSLSVIALSKDWLFAILAALTIKLVLSAEETRQKDMERTLMDRVLRDPLTEILNRRAFDSHLKAAVERAKRSGSRLSVAFIDLDGFKKANDRFGHAFGDAVLRAVAERLRQLLRSADIVARLGGDEFGLIIESDNGGLILEVTTISEKELNAWVWSFGGLATVLERKQ